MNYIIKRTTTQALSTTTTTPPKRTASLPTVHSKGFSLVELLVVVAILAILAAIAIPLFLNQRSKAAQGAVQSDARNVATDLSSLLKTFPITSDTTVSLDANTKTVTLNSGGSVDVVQLTVSPSTTVTLRSDVNTRPALVFMSDNLENYSCSITLPSSGFSNLGFDTFPRCGVVISEEGNLLTYNQATFTQTTSSVLSTGWVYAGLTPEFEDVGGERVANLTVRNVTYTPYSFTEDFIFSNLNIDLNKPLTGSIELKKGDVQSRPNATVCLRIFSVYTGVNGANMLVNKCELLTLTDEWQKVSLTSTLSGFAETPVEAYLIHFPSGAANSEGGTYKVKNPGIWQGESGTWALPGQPIVKP